MSKEQEKIIDLKILSLMKEYIHIYNKTFFATIKTIVCLFQGICIYENDGASV